jgi:hypothetical protein
MYGSLGTVDTSSAFFLFASALGTPKGAGGLAFHDWQRPAWGHHHSAVGAPSVPPSNPQKWRLAGLLRPGHGQGRSLGTDTGSSAYHASFSAACDSPRGLSGSPSRYTIGGAPLFGAMEPFGAASGAPRKR